MLELYIPTLNDLWFRKKYLKNTETMAYNKGYDVSFDGYNKDTGAIDFSEDKWESWRKKWIGNEPERFCAFIKRKSDGTFVGEVSWHWDLDVKEYVIGIVIDNEFRGNGYSIEALKLLGKKAQTFGIKSICNNIPSERVTAIKAHIKAGFKLENDNRNFCFLRLPTNKTSKDIEDKISFNKLDTEVTEKKLSKEFYNVNAVALAEKLLGKMLCVKTNNEIIRRVITETEAYAEGDSANHAFKGRTKRNDPVFYEAGTIYVYLCYGMHEMLNISANKEGVGEAVLIRGIDGYIGPGRVTKFLKVSRDLNYEDVTSSNKIWIEDNIETVNSKYTIEKLKRVGIGYAKIEDQNKLWRFKLNIS